jgi:hypothetical protein
MERKQNKKSISPSFEFSVNYSSSFLVHPHVQMKRISLLKACIAEWNTKNQNNQQITF